MENFELGDSDTCHFGRKAINKQVVKAGQYLLGGREGSLG